MAEIDPRTLRDYLVQAFGVNHINLEIQELVSLNHGWESDVYRFQSAWGQPGQRRQDTFILRIFPGIDASEKSIREYEALTLLSRAAYPVPRVYLLERNHSPFGKPFMVMEYVEGSSMWGPMFHGPPEERARLMETFCALFARLHALDWRPLVSEPDRFEPRGSNSVISMELARWQPYIDSLPARGFRAAFEWLRSHVQDVKSQNVVPVHWDFHPENVLVTRTGRAVVIDWTGFDLTDYRFDLAWTLLVIGSHEGLQWREPVLRAYELQAQHEVVDLDFFDTACGLRRLFSVVASLTYGAEKMGMPPGAEITMRRQAPAIRIVYEMVLERTGLPIAEVEQFLAEADPPKI